MMGRYHLQEREPEYFRHADWHLKKQKQNNDWFWLGELTEKKNYLIDCYR